MDLHNFLNVQRVYRMQAAQWGCPVWMVKWIIRRFIDQSWKRTIYDPVVKALWNTHMKTERMYHIYSTGKGRFDTG